MTTLTATQEIPDEITISPNPKIQASPAQRAAALTVLFIELTKAIKHGCTVNIDNPNNIYVTRPL